MKGFFESSVLQTARPSVGLVPKCGACGLFKKCQSPKMPVHGKGRKGVLVVGEAPGETEDDEGRPFVGKAGKFLRDTLWELDIDLDRDAWTTNAIICRPPNNQVPDTNQIEYCHPNLAKVIAAYEPVAIVTLGRVALTSVLTGYWDEVGAMARWTGWQIPLEKHWVCPTYHPNYLLRSRNEMMDRLFAKDLERAFAFESYPPPQPDFQKLITLLYEEDAICQALQEMDEDGGWVAADYESNCLKPEYEQAQLRSFSVSNRKRTISYPWIGKAVAATGRFLRSNKTRKIASNLKFEERWTRKTFGHGITNWGWDTMLASHVLDSREGICSLKFQSLVRLGVPIYNRNIDPYLSSGKGLYNSIAEISLKDLLFYGGMDGLLEYRLAMVQRKDMGYE